MAMHGILSPSEVTHGRTKGRRTRLMNWVRRRRAFLAIVVFPTAITGSYLYAVASDQYETEAHFVIQSADGGGTSASFGSILGLSGPVTPTQSQAMGITDYLQSQEAVDQLQAKLNLISLYRQGSVDSISKLQPSNPTPERLLSYYKDKVSIHYDRDTGISTLTAKAFTAKDSYQIAEQLLKMSEQQINLLNARSYRDGVNTARLQLAEAEKNASDIERDITAYRQNHADINPIATGQAQTGMVTTMNASLATARAQLQSMRGVVTPSSPQYRALEAHLRAMESEVATQSGSIAGGSKTTALKLGGYEDLKIRQEFAAKRYDAAAASFEKAKDQARRQSLYLLRVVNPVKPVKSMYPQRGAITFTVFLALFVCYAIGWLIIAGVREHAL